MKAQSKRFVDHLGKAFVVQMANKKKKQSDKIGFLDLWRYSTNKEVCMTLLSVVLASVCGCALVAAIAVYAELCALMLRRIRGEVGDEDDTTPLIMAFGGGVSIDSKNQTIHTAALIQDCLGFTYASIVIVVVQLISASSASIIAHHAAGSLVKRLRVSLFRAALRQEMAYFETNTSLNLATALVEDIEKIRSAVGEQVVMTSYLSSTAIACAVASLCAAGKLASAALSLLPLCALAAAAAHELQVRYSARERQASSVASLGVQEALTGIETVRAYNTQTHEADRYEAALHLSNKHAVRRALASGLGTAAGWTLTYVLHAVVIAYGAQLWTVGAEYSAALLMQILMYTVMASQNVTMCQSHLEMFSSARGACSHIYKLLEREPEIDALSEEGLKPSKFRGDVVFDNVYFNYPSRPDVKVLRGFNLSIKAGQTVALVGPSGCGKSTTLQLLQRLYCTNSGTVLVDGHRLEELNIQHLRQSIGVVGQEPVLYSGTIRDNIALGDHLATDDDVITAAKMAHAHEFIVKLVDGYKTRIGERGASLSGGQKQRIALARALLRKPNILVLDEPTAALDAKSEKEVQAALDAASEGRTTIVVSHRLSTIRNASQIVYVCQGAVLEKGTHEELVQSQGLYWRLLNGAGPKNNEDKKPEEENKVKEELVRESVRESFNRASLVRASTTRGSIRIPGMSQIAVTAMEATEEEESKQIPSASLFTMLRLCSKSRGILALAGLCALLVGASLPAFAMFFARFFALFIDADIPTLLSASHRVCAYYVICAIAVGVLTTLQHVLLARAGNNNANDLRRRLFLHFTNQDQSFFDRPENGVGALCARLSADCAAVHEATGMHLGTILQGVGTMSLGLSLAFYYSWKMTIVSALSIPIVVGGIYIESVVSRKSASSSRESCATAASTAVEATTNIAALHSLGVQTTFIEKYRAALDAAGTSTGILRGTVYAICVVAPTAGFTIALSYGAYLLATDGLPYKDVLFISEALMYGAWMLAESLSFAPSAAAASRAAGNILQALGEKSRVRDDDVEEVKGWKPTGSISISSLKFSYPSRPKVGVLDNITLRVKPGEKLALVGHSGSGKSTILHLIMRGYDPNSGTISLDEHNTRRIPLKQLRANIALVPQQGVIFSRSVKENIALGDITRDVPIDEIIDVAKKADIHDFIAALPQGYDTAIDNSTLSGGQRARLSICRALLRRASILLLDEPTAALDAATEAAVSATISSCCGDSSRVVVAHRLTTITDSDNVAVLHAGRVVEYGPPKELLKARGHFWRLWQHNAGGGTGEM